MAARILLRRLRLRIVAGLALAGVVAAMPSGAQQAAAQAQPGPAGAARPASSPTR